MSDDNNFLQDLVLLRNDPEAAERIRKAAWTGNVDAQYAMGLVYAEGRGVPIDLVKAYAWLTVAVMQADKDADLLRNIVGSQMSDGEFDEGKACAARFIAELRLSWVSH